MRQGTGDQQCYIPCMFCIEISPQDIVHSTLTMYMPLKVSVGVFSRYSYYENLLLN